MWLLITLACASSDPEPAATAAGELSPDDAAIVAGASRDAEPTPAELQLQLQRIDERLSRLELAVAELKTEGVLPAEFVSYDPRKTTLDAKELQSAIDELALAVDAIEAKTGQDMGQAGSGLFELPKGGGQQGQMRGGPPGGQGGPPGGQGGPQGGQGGMGGPQGGQGGMQGGQGGMQGGMGGGQGGMGGQQGGMGGGQGGMGGQQGGMGGQGGQGGQQGGRSGGGSGPR